MQRIDFDCYKVAAKIPLVPFAFYFGLQEQSHRKEYLEIKEDCLARIIKYNRVEQSVYIFECGCITFVNFNAEEMHIFFHFMDTISKLNKQLYFDCRQSFSISVEDKNAFCLVEQTAELEELNAVVIPTIGIALAKLTALVVMEEELKKIFDEAEVFVERMQKGKINIRAIKYARETAKILRFEYNSAYCIRIFERCDIANSFIESRILFDRFLENFEYRKRIKVLQQKMAALHDIFNLFIVLSQNWQEDFELYIEIFLLAIFPFFYL